MSRLTKREKEQLCDGEEFVVCNHDKADCDDSCMYGRCKWNDKAIEKLKAYEDKEEQGLLIEIPLRVGDKFWELSWSNDSFYPRVAHSLSHVVYCMERLGKWCFLTESEAEEALARMKGE